MPGQSTTKLLRTVSSKITRDFLKLIKAVARNATKGNHNNAAFVIGYMDACTGYQLSFKGISDSHHIAYSKGWQAASGHNPRHPKRKSA